MTDASVQHAARRPRHGQGMPEGEPIEAKSVSKGVRTAQKTVEARNFEIRKNVLKYDDVMNKQRTVIYSERQAVLKGEDIHGDIERFIADTIDSYIKGARRVPASPPTGIGTACSRPSRPCSRSSLTRTPPRTPPTSSRATRPLRPCATPSSIRQGGVRRT